MSEQLCFQCTYGCWFSRQFYVLIWVEVLSNSSCQVHWKPFKFFQDWNATFKLQSANKQLETGNSETYRKPHWRTCSFTLQQSSCKVSNITMEIIWLQTGKRIFKVDVRKAIFFFFKLSILSFLFRFPSFNSSQQLNVSVEAKSFSFSMILKFSHGILRNLPLIVRFIFRELFKNCSSKNKKMKQRKLSSSIFQSNIKF